MNLKQKPERKLVKVIQSCVNASFKGMTLAENQMFRLLAQTVKLRRSMKLNAIRIGGGI